MYNENSDNGPKISTFVINPSAGYFVIDKLAIGVDLVFTSITTKSESETYTRKNTSSIFSILPSLTYYFKSDSKFLPYLGLGLGYSTSTEKYSRNYKDNYSGYHNNDYNEKSSVDSFTWKGKGGVVYLFTPSIGIDLGISYLGTSGKFDSDSDIKVRTNTFGVNAGLIFMIK